MCTFNGQYDYCYITKGTRLKNAILKMQFIQYESINW